MKDKHHFDCLANRKITVVGLGHFGGGVGVSRWLCGQGAKVTVTDAAAADKLSDSVAQLSDLDVTFHLGGHEEKDFTQADLLVVNPAVPKEMSLLQAAQRAGVARTSEINLFIQRCPARIVGITGSVGKSTTTAMIGDILRRRFTTHVGGNIGGSLLESLDRIAPSDVVVLELSSFQLEDLPLIAVSPHLAVVTNLKPNHLDRHGTLEAYGEAKKNIFRFQGKNDVLVLNADDPPTEAWASEAQGKVVFFSTKKEKGDWLLKLNRPVQSRGSNSQPPSDNIIANSPSTNKHELQENAEPFDLLLPGAHNQANAQAAWTAARQLGVDRATAQEALREFKGLPHRLQFVCERGGVRYFNDSKCTTPEGAIVALESFEPRRVIQIVGGYDKHVSFDAFGAALAARAKTVVALGVTKDQIVAAIQKHVAQPQAIPQILVSETFDAAVAAAQKSAAPGDVVLLSPACASWDMFTNYEKRGERFVELVTQ
jgi:UDP-N-acetylmuramoylalanine--D-glutamate ligase